MRAASTPPPQSPSAVVAPALAGDGVGGGAAPVRPGTAPGLPFKLKFVFDNPLEVKLRPVVKRRQSSASCYGSSASAAAAARALGKRPKARAPPPPTVHPPRLDPNIVHL